MTPLTEKIFERFPAFRSRDFLIFWIGQAVSLIGTWMQSTTLPYLAYRISGRPLDLGLIGFAATLPTLFLALPGGVIIERLDKRKSVIVLQSVMMLQAFALAYLAITGIIQIWHIVVLSFIMGIASAFEITARQAMLVELVGKPALPNAIALQATVFNSARVLGPMAAAPFLLLLQDQGEGWAFFANGVSYLFVVIGLFFVKTPFRVPAPDMHNRDLFQEFKDGQRYILSTNTISTLILMASVIGFFGFPFSQQIPAIARDVLAQAGDTDAIVAARNSALYTFQGVGALIAALFLASFSGFKRKGMLLTLGQFGFILALIAISFVRSLPLALPIILVLGWGTVTQLATMNTLIQLEVPDHLRGRVFSTYLWALQGIAPFGSLAIGWMAQTWDVPTTALIVGLLCLVVIGVTHLRNPNVRLMTG